MAMGGFGLSQGDDENEEVDGGDAQNWHRMRRHHHAQLAESSPLDPMAWLSLRRLVCGGEANKRCMADER